MKRALLLVAALLCLALAACGSRPKPSGAVTLRHVPSAMALDRAVRFGAISSPPTVGDSITTSNGTWTNSPISFAYQWQDCTAGPSCTDITGATGQGYVIAAADVGLMLRVGVTASNSLGSATQYSALTATVIAGPVPPPGNGDGTTGSIVYEANFNTPNSPIINLSGAPNPFNPQAWNYGDHNCTTLNGGKCPEYWFTQSGGYDGVSNSANIFFQPKSQCPITCFLQFVAEGGPHYASNQVGTTTYETLALYIPSGGWAPSNGSNELEIQELHFNPNVTGAAAIKFTVNADHVTLDLALGAAVNRTAQYWSDADHYPSHPLGSTLLPVGPEGRGWYAIPPGQVVNGAWNEIVFKTDWEITSTGSFTTWYRSYNPSTGVHTTWTQSDAFSGFPTTLWVTGSAPPPTWNDGPELYGSSSTNGFNTWLAGYCDATGFAAAASCMP